jgi:hypothetical protein
MCRRIRLVVSALSVALVAASSAHAANIPFTGTLTFKIPFLDPLVVAGAGVAAVNGSSGGSHINSLSLPAGAFATTGLLLPTTDVGAQPLAGLQLTVSNGAGAPLLPGGAMPLSGSVRVCLFAPCASIPVANLSVPLGIVGAGGTAFVTGPANLTVIGAPWTVSTAAVGAATAMGFRHGPASATSSTALESGVIQLVTPIFVSTNIGAQPVLPVFGILTLHFVPEPGTLLLISAGLAAMGVAGRRSLASRMRA